MGFTNVVKGPGDEDELQRNPRPQSPEGNFRKALGTAQHELMHVEEDHEHGDDTQCRCTTRGGKKQAKTAGNLGNSAEPNPKFRMRIVIGHDVYVERGMPEVVGAGEDIEAGLGQQAELEIAHRVSDDLSVEDSTVV